MPMASTISSVSLIPAVSIKVTGTPLITSSDSTRSLVVPGTSVTMARSALLRRFSKLDLPTLGGPMMATRSPSRSSCPPAASAIMASNWVRTSTRAAHTAWPSSGGHSSSKSIRASISANWSSNAERMLEMAFPKPPSRPLRASWTPCAERALMMSARASAWVRSSRPLRNARCVNSPGDARRAPQLNASRSTCCTTTNPP
mmetsp:Transcript_1265/g.2562  ORF Transcript_1265/g.2562 Transcript_1265/m.2562 type:complete len:201 (-) Transcript_1265:932-1534(-)